MKENAAKRNIIGGKATVCPWIERALQKYFPPIQVFQVEESSDSSEASKEEMQETMKETDVETEETHPSTATRDTSMEENESKEEDQFMETEDQEGNSDDDTVPKLTKDSTSGKSTMHQSHSTAPSTLLQSENKQIYMHGSTPQCSRDSKGQRTT
jgi:hypothetical protein